MVSKFSAFNITNFTFKTIRQTHLVASVLVPKSLKPGSGSHPLLVHFHGGGFILGDKLFEPWFPLWLIQLAESKGAVIISPDYRLLPEAKGTEMLDDVKDFWSWVHTSLPSEALTILPSDTSIDLDKIAAAGESAGGYLALQSGFLFPEARIKLVMSQYGTIDLDHPDYNPGPYHVPASGSTVDKYITTVKPGSIRISSMTPDWQSFCTAVLQEGRHRDMIGNDDDLRLMSTIKQAKKIPAIWLVQGAQDPIVPRTTADHFSKIMKKEHPDTPLLLTMQPGSHGFDVETELKEEWVQLGCKFIQGFWP